MIVYVADEKRLYEVVDVEGVLTPKYLTPTEDELKALIGEQTTAAMEFKGATDTLPATGENGYIYLVPKTPPDTGYEQYVWTDSGWVDLGTEQITLDKQSILTALGYEETEIKMIDTDDNIVAVTVLTEI